MKKKLIFIIVLFLLTTGCKQNISDTDYLANGQQYLSKYEYYKALDEFEKGKIAYPNEENYYLSIAEIHSKKNNIEEAINILLDGYNHTSSSQISNALGQLYLKRGNLDRAEEWFNRAYLQNNEDINALKGKVKVLALENKITEIRELLEVDKSSFDSELFIMSALVNLDDTNKASSLIMQSNSKDTRNLELAKELRVSLVGYERAKTVHSLGRIAYILLSYDWYEMAQIPISKITDKNQFYENGYIYEGLIQVRVNHLQEAEQTFKKVLEINPQNTDVKIFLIQTYFLQDDFEEANNLVSELLENEEEDLSIQGYKSLQEILYRNQRNAEIIELYNKYSSKLELTPELNLVVIEILMDEQKFTQVENIFSKMEDKYSQLIGAQQASYTAMKAYDYFNLGKKQEALVLIDEAEKIDNTASLVHYYKGRMLLEDEKLEEGYDALARAKELDLSGNIILKVNRILNEN